MPLNRYVVRVDPQGQSVTVDILDTSGVSVVVYDSPQFGAATLTLPLTITAQTDFWLHDPGPYDVSCKVGGAEVADAGAPKRVQVSDVPVLVVPDWARERTAASSGGSSSAPSLSVIGYGDGNGVGIDAYLPLIGSVFDAAPAAIGAFVSDLSVPIAPGGAVVANAANQGIQVAGLGLTGAMSVDLNNQLMRVTAWNPTGSQYLSLVSPASGVPHITVAAPVLTVDLSTFTVQSQIGSDLSVVDAAIVSAAGGAFSFGIYTHPTVTT